MTPRSPGSRRPAAAPVTAATGSASGGGPGGGRRTDNARQRRWNRGAVAGPGGLGRRWPAGHPGAQCVHHQQPAAGGDAQRHRCAGPGPAAAARPVRQDRHHQRRGGRLVCRLPAQHRRGGLDRLRHAAQPGPAGVRRRPGPAGVDQLHGAGAEGRAGAGPGGAAGRAGGGGRLALQRTGRGRHGGAHRHRRHRLGRLAGPGRLGRGRQCAGGWAGR